MEHIMGKLDQKVSIVTGAGRGIGRGIAEKLASEGAIVVVTDVDEQSAVTTAKELGGAGVDRHVGLRVDVTDRDSAAATSWSTTPAGTRSVRSSTATRPTGTGSSPSTCTACSTPARPCCRSWP